MNLKPFQDPDGTFSWRKTGTGLCFALFAFLVVGNAIAHNFEETPTGYLTIFGLVFGAYFLKQPLSKISIGKKENTNSSSH